MDAKTLANETRELETYFGYRYDAENSDQVEGRWRSFEVFDSRKGLDAPCVVRFRLMGTQCRTTASTRRAVKAELERWLNGLRKNARRES